MRCFEARERGRHATLAVHCMRSPWAEEDTERVAQALPAQGKNQQPLNGARERQKLLRARSWTAQLDGAKTQRGGPPRAPERSWAAPRAPAVGGLLGGLCGVDMDDRPAGPWPIEPKPSTRSSTCFNDEASAQRHVSGSRGAASGTAVLPAVRCDSLRLAGAVFF